MRYDKKNRELVERGTRKPEGYLFPAFMLNVPVSHTAKLIYMLLLNEALDRRSKRNHIWYDKKPVVTYPLKDIAKDVGRGLTVVKESVAELEKFDLIRKCTHQGHLSEFKVQIPLAHEDDDPAVVNGYLEVW